MRESDPRPMPSVVKAAYRNPTDLERLLSSQVYSSANRRAVRDDLLEEIVRHRGMAEISEGKNGSIPLTEAVALTKDVAKQVDVIVSAVDYGGVEETLPYLARAMETRWLQWWEEQEWKTFDHVTEWSEVIQHVVGERQSVWMAAQYARFVFELVPDAYKSIAAEAIESAEAWSLATTQENRQRAGRAARAAYRVKESMNGSTASYAIGAAWGSAFSADLAAAAIAVNGGYASSSAAGHLRSTIALCAEAISRSRARVASLEEASPPAAEYARVYEELSEFAKVLFTPTLLSQR